MKNLTKEQKEQFNSIFNDLSKALDISESQYKVITDSYQAVGTWLAEGTQIKSLVPEIRPQGSFLLGTTIKPINPNDDIDIDLVCELRNKPYNWTQYNLKESVGNRIKEHTTYSQMLEKQKGGRRCWTLLYRQNADAKEKFHLDILPCFIEDARQVIWEQISFDNAIPSDKFGIRITDNQKFDYKTSTDITTWLKSNPIGYAQWFYQRAITHQMRLFSLREAIQPVPKYQQEKYPLQRIVQILKRHRDIMFQGNENKPISIIITTLAAKAYQGENIVEGLYNIVHTMDKYIENRNGIYWISNPINDKENFADKWEEAPIKRKNFFDWKDRLQKDVDAILSTLGMYAIQDSLTQPFGRDLIIETFSARAKELKSLRDSNNLKMMTTGVLSTAASIPVKPHTFYGKDKDA